MIQPQELRIGNLISDINGNLCLVKTIREDLIIAKYHGVGSCIGDKEQFKPVELTEEILLKFRYKKIRDNEFLFDNHFIIFIKESKIDFCLFNSEGNDFFVCEIQFAHELQNLHYSIRKEELQFKQTT